MSNKQAQRDPSDPVAQLPPVQVLNLPILNLQDSLPSAQWQAPVRVIPQQPSSAKPVKRLRLSRRSEIIRSNSLPEPRQARRSLLLPNEHRRSSAAPSPPNSARPSTFGRAPRPGTRQVPPPGHSSVDLSSRDRDWLVRCEIWGPERTTHSTRIAHREPQVSNLGLAFVTRVTEVCPDQVWVPSATAAHIPHCVATCESVGTKQVKTCESDKTCTRTGPALHVQGKKAEQGEMRGDLHQPGNGLENVVLLHQSNSCHSRQMFHFRGKLCVPAPRFPLQTPCMTSPTPRLGNFEHVKLVNLSKNISNAEWHTGRPQLLPIESPSMIDSVVKDVNMSDTIHHQHLMKQASGCDPNNLTTVKPVKDLSSDLTDDVKWARALHLVQPMRDNSQMMKPRLSDVQGWAYDTDFNHGHY